MTLTCHHQWALGVITYEFLYGIPPFHDKTPEKVFENILSGHIEWHEDYVEVSPEAKDFMQRLMTLDPAKRLGANGADEVKAHPFFTGIDWDQRTKTNAIYRIVSDKHEGWSPHVDKEFGNYDYLLGIDVRSHLACFLRGEP